MRVALLATLTTLVVCQPELAAQDSRFLAKEDILLYGIGLKVEPAQQTVPKDIATIVSTYLQAPNDPAAALPPFAPDAVVMGTLRGPSFPGSLDLTAQPNTPFNIPPLTVAGPHTLDDIRLVSHGEVLLRGTPESVTINVIDKLLVTQITARPLTAAEIREKGIVFDKSNFQAYNFTAAFAIQDTKINIDFPVVLPTLQGAADVTVSQVGIPAITPPLLPSLKTIIPDTLKIQTQVPNLSVIGFTLKVPEIKGQSFIVPPIPGVIVIPGDIGFLNQFFSVLLMVSNVAPDGSNLVVSDLTATIVLPAGNDTVVGTPDDPLAMAKTASGETPRVRPVTQLGPDGQLGSADDITTLGPGETGNAEFLVEGRREGSHVVEMELAGTLNGLPVGPVPIRGRAAGAVLVRNPTFTLTFTHPDVVTAGEPYTLDVTVSNTSESPANFVSVNLNPRNISGARLVGEPSRDIETIAPGDSQSVTFDLISNITGKVTAATIDSDAHVAGRFELKHSVGELGVPLSPDSLVLPREASLLPKSLRDAAIGLLGKAYAVATAPPAALPKDVKRFSKQTVWDRATEVAEAGLRIALHEPLRDSATELGMDFAGSNFPRLSELNPTPEDLQFARDNYSGFDDLRRRSIRGDVFAQAVADLMTADLQAMGVSAFHRDAAQKIAHRPGHISVLAGTSGGPLPVALRVVDSQNHQLGGVDVKGKVVKQIAFSDYLVFNGTGGQPVGEMALIAAPDPGDFSIHLDLLTDVPVDTPFTLSLVVPRADGRLRQIVFDNLTAGSQPTIALASDDPYRLTITFGGLAGNGRPVAPSADAGIVDLPPSILGVVQQAQADVLGLPGGSIAGEDGSAGINGGTGGIPVGRVVAVLFSEEVTPASVQDGFRPENITAYEPEANTVVGVALQPGRRIVFLALRDPFGPFIPRTITMSGIADARGHVMASQTVPMEATVPDDGGVVTGRVIQADGTAVPFANVRLFYQVEGGWAGISSKSADAQGRYSWDYVTRMASDRIVAVDPETEEFRDIRFNIQRNGQRLNVDIVLLGRGTFKGRTLDERGQPLANTSVRITSLTDQSQYGATTDATGSFAVGRIPVGNMLVEAVNTVVNAKTFISENIPFAGATTTRDIFLLDVTFTQVTVKHGTLSGHVLRVDGATPVNDLPVVVYYASNSQPGVLCPGNPPPSECAIALANTDAAGAFAFADLVAGKLRISTFDQAAYQQGEVQTILAADASAAVNILLSAGLGTVHGIVLDPIGKGVAGARVGGGLSLTATDANGQFTLTDVPVGHATITAVSDSLGMKGQAAVDIVRAGEVVGATIVLESVGGVGGVVREADGTTPVPAVNVFLFKPGQNGTIDVVGTAVTDSQGRYAMMQIAIGDYSVSAFRPDFSDGNITALSIKFFNQVAKADITFRGGGGRVTGTVFDDDGVTPLKARASVSGDQLLVAGGRVGVRFEYVQNFKIVDTDFTTGSFTMGGLWVGPFTLRAAGQFSPDPIALENTMPSAGATVHMDIRLQPTSQVSGRVFLPDGVTPAGPNIIVKYKSDEFKIVCASEDNCTTIPQGIQEEIVVTDADGKFGLPLVNAGTFTLTVEDQATGKTGQVHGSVKAGENVDVSVRLVGLGGIAVQVIGGDGTTPIPGARVVVEQVDFPKKTVTAFADALGMLALAGGDSFSEGAFVVKATDVRNGFTGRAAGQVVSDGQQVALKVFLFNQAGVVYGTVFKADGLTPVPNAETIVSGAGGPLAFTVTDNAGSYRVEQIPLGPVSVDVFEAATARRGFGSGQIFLNAQEVPIDVTEAALGVVRGTVLETGRLSPLKGWEVSLSQSSPGGRGLPGLRTTSSVDGTFSFPGVSRGAVALSARKDGVNGYGSAAGAVEREGQVVDIPLLATIIRPLVANIEGVALNPDGSPASSSLIDICSGACPSVDALTVTAASDGSFAVHQLPLGRYGVQARSQVSRNTGAALTELSFDGQTVSVTVAMIGVSEIDGQVVRGDGSPAGNVQLTLEGNPSSGCALSCANFADPGGNFSFVNVPAKTFTITATDPISALKGVVGDTLNPGEIKIVRIVLEPTGSVRGRVLFQNASVAAGVVAELVVGNRHLFTQSGADGTFAFETTTLGTFALNFEDPVGSGIARKSGTIAGNLDLGDVRLDEAPPAVGSVTPAPAATGVPLNSVVRVQFTEQVDASTITATGITLSDETGQLGGTLALTSGDTVVTFTPLAPLKQSTRYALRVTGVKDVVGKIMPTDYVASFTTIDLTPPSYLDVSPVANTGGVTIYTTVRIKLSESIDPSTFRGPPIVVTGPAGPIDGRIDYAFGNTVIVFTPKYPLAEATSHRVQVSAATDLSGNVQPQGLDYTFSTTDRTPPPPPTLVGPPSVVENGIARVTADVGASHDVAFVDFFINSVFINTSRTPPFALAFQATPAFGKVGDQIGVTAISTDTSGNRSAASAPATLTVTVDQPPVVRLTAPVDGLVLANGDRVVVNVRATDDLGVAQLGYKAQTGKPQDAALKTIAPTVTEDTESFGFNVPLDAAPGATILIEASASDTKGQVGQAAPITITVRDTVAPTVSITGASTGDKIKAGQQTTVVVSAQDLGGVRTINFSATGVVVLSDSRTIDPVQNNALTSFSFQVPASARPGDSVTLHASAVDKAGNSGTAASVILPVADTVAPTVQLRTDTGRLTIVAGRIVHVVASASDGIAVARIELTGNGAFTLSDAKQVMPPAGSAELTFDINVPDTLAPGAVLNMQARAFDTAGNVSAPAFLSLAVTQVSDVSLPPSAIVNAGQSIEVEVDLPSGTPAGGLLVSFISANPAIATVTPSVTFAAGETSKTVSVTGQSGGTVKLSALVQGVERASMTIAVQGGMVDGQVFDALLNPAAGVQVTVTDSYGANVAAVTDGSGRFAVTGLSSPFISVKALDPFTGLRGFATATMNAPNGFAHVNVVLIPAGAIHGTVFQADGQTPAGGGAKVEIFASTDLVNALSTTFTSAAGTYEFPLVTLGSYVIDASTVDGRRGRASVALASGQDVAANITFLGRGSVVGTVFDGNNQPVANAALTLGSSNLFGSVVFTRNAELDGTFRFDGLPVGTFFITAHDPVTNRAAYASGTIGHDQDEVRSDLHLATYGNVLGTVFRSDGVTVVPNASVSVDGIIGTTTDAAGHYSASFLPLGGVSVVVYDAATRAMGRATGTLSLQGQTLTMDVRLQGQGTVVATVTDASGNPVGGASVTIYATTNGFEDSLTGTTSSSGLAVIDHVLAGTLTITATSGTLRGALSAIALATGEVKQVTVALEPTGSITGTVFAPDGQTPMTSGRVVVGSGDPHVWFDAAAQQALTDGTFRFDGLNLTATVPPAGGPWVLLAYDSQGRFRAQGKPAVALTANGQVATRNLTLVGLGNVVGRVVNPDGSSAPDMSVWVRDLNPDFGGFFNARTNAAGFYEVNNVAVGRLAVSTGDESQGVLGEAAGVMGHDGETVTLDVLLQGNAITLPANRYDANNFLFDLQPDGSVRSGSFSAYSGADAQGGALLDVVAGGVASRFTGSPIGTVEQSGRQVITREQNLAGLNVTRKIFVPKDGYFARYLELLSNPTSNPITIDLKLTSHIRAVSNPMASIVATSSGDGVLNVSGADNPDRWMMIDDADADPFLQSNLPSLAFAFDGPGAADRVAAADFTTTFTNCGSYGCASTGHVVYQWSSVTIPAGGTVGYVHFLVQETSQAGARTAADRLMHLAPEALVGLSSDEIGEIRNFAVPADATSTVAPLPSLGGSVTGRLFEGDGLTPIVSTLTAPVRLKSADVLFGRTWSANTDATGQFAFASSFDDNGNSRLIPVEAFTLRASHPITGVEAPSTLGSFVQGEVVSAQDLIFSNTSILTGTVRRHTGQVVTSGTVSSSVFNGAASVLVSSAIGSDGAFRFTGMPAATTTLTATVPNPQGSALTGSVTFDVTAGRVIATDVIIDATGAISGSIQRGSGSPVPSISITLDGSGFSRSTVSDTGGAFTFTDVPEGSFTLRAVDPTTGLPASAPAIVRRDQTSTVTLTFAAVGRLDVQVNFARGAPAPGAAVQLQEAVRGTSFRAIGQTDGGGHLTMNGLNAGAFAVSAVHPDNSRMVGSASGTLTVDGSVMPVTITLPLSATVTGTITDQSGPVSGVTVTVRSSNAAFGGFQSTTSDAAGVYAVVGVPEGAFTATVQDFTRQLFGETLGSVAVDGEPVTANISLINNYVQLPISLYDANGALYYVEGDGRTGGGTNYAFGYYWDSATGASQLEILRGGAATLFLGASEGRGTTEQNGREIVVRQADLSGLNVTRKVYVPRNGYFARYLELLTNPTNAPIAVGLRVRSTLGSTSYGPTSLVTTSSGNATLDVSDGTNPDRWVTFDDAQDVDPWWVGSTPPTAFVFDGEGAPLRASVATVTGNGTAQATLTYQWDGVVVPAGQTVAVMHYVVQQVSRAGAAAAVTRLSGVPPEALEGLAPEEIAAVQNFVLPSDGLSSIEPLPSLTGSISGRVLASDASTGVVGASVQFKSLNPFFGRVRNVSSDAAGGFLLKGRIEPPPDEPLPVPVGPFTLHAQHPETGVAIDQRGDFTGEYSGNLALAMGTATASSFVDYYAYYAPANAIDTSTGSYWQPSASTAYGNAPPWLDVTFPIDVGVSSVAISSAYLQRARVDLLDAAGQIVATADSIDTSSGTAEVMIAGQGVRRVRITDEADQYFIQVYDVKIMGTAPAAAGAARQDVVFSNTGTVVATVHRYNGDPISNVSWIQWNLSGAGVSVQRYVYPSGSTTLSAETFTGLPQGQYSLTALTSQRLSGSATVTVTNGSTSTIDVSLPSGSIQGTLVRADGAPSAGASVQATYYYSIGYYSYSFTAYVAADASGNYVFPDLPLGYIQLQFREPRSGYTAYGSAYLAQAGDVVTENLTFPAIGSVQVHVQYARGTPVASLQPLLTTAVGQSYWCCTDANGDITLTNVVQGTFTVRAANPQNSNLFAEVTGQIVNEGDSPAVTITLPAAGSITGTVTKPDGTPMAYPAVYVEVPGAGELGPSVTNANGQFTINGVPAGQSLKVRAYWGSPYPYRVFYGETPFTLSADGDAQTVNVRLPGFATVTIHVTQGDGVTPWTGAYVYSSDDFRPNFQSRGLTDANGNLTLQKTFSNKTAEQFAEGGFTVQIVDPNTGAALLRASGTVGFANVNSTVSVLIAASVLTGNITGHVYANDPSTPLVGAYVQVLNAADSVQLKDSVFTGADGSYTFSGVRPGQSGYVIRVYGLPYIYGSVFTDRSGAFSTAGETQVRDFILPITPATISGTVFAGDGATPVSDVQVALIDSLGTQISSVYSDASGMYTFGIQYLANTSFQVTAIDYNHSGGLSASFNGTIPGVGAHVTVDLTLPLSVIKGFVRYADGADVPNPNVIAVDDAGASRYASTFANGYYVVFNTPPGPVTLTAQDGNSGLSVTTTGVLADITAALTLDLQLPPSGTITGVVLDADGNPVSSAPVTIVSPNLAFQRSTYTDNLGVFTFDRVPVGSVYAQTSFYDGIAQRYVSASGDVVADQTLTLALAWTGGGTVAGTVRNAAGGTPADAYVLIRAFGGSGPNGTFSSDLSGVSSGIYTFTGVPAGAVQVYVYDNTDGSVGLANGVVATGAMLTLDTQLGNAVSLTGNLDGDDGFRYDVANEGQLNRGGTVNRSTDSAYRGADYLQVNGLDFPYLDAARPDVDVLHGLMLGPVSMGNLLVTRKVWVPTTGGFARYLESVSNPTAEVQTAVVSVTGSLGSSWETNIAVPPSATGNTYAITDAPNCDCTPPTLGHVFEGSGTPIVVTVSAPNFGQDGYFSFRYEVTLAPGATAIFMHFEIQRGQNDTGGAEMQALDLVNLADPNAMVGMSEAEKAQVVNFSIPIASGALLDSHAPMFVGELFGLVAPAPPRWRDARGTAVDALDLNGVMQ